MPTRLEDTSLGDQPSFIDIAQKEEWLQKHLSRPWHLSAQTCVPRFDYLAWLLKDLRSDIQHAGALIWQAGKTRAEFDVPTLKLARATRKLASVTRKMLVEVLQDKKPDPDDVQRRLDPANDAWTQIQIRQFQPVVLMQEMVNAENANDNE